MQNGRIPCKITLHLKTLCYNVSDKVVRHSLAYLSMQKMLRGGRPLLRQNLAE